MTDELTLIESEVLGGGGLTPSQAAKTFPAVKGRNTNVCPSTVWRWMRRGVRLSDGSRLKLEAVRWPSGWLTSEGAIRRFLLGMQDAPAAGAPSPRTPTQRDRAAGRAGDALKRMGA